MRNPDCRKYDECLMETAKKNGKLECSGCPEMNLIEKDVHTDWPEGDPDYFRFYQSHQKGDIAMTTKICSNPNCKHKGEPQDISRFSKNPVNKDGYAGVCYDCRNQQNKDREAAKKAGTYVSRKGKGRNQKSSSCAKASEDREGGSQTLRQARDKGERLQIMKDTAAKRAAKKVISPMPAAIVDEGASSLPAPVIDMTGNNEIYRTAAAIFVRAIEKRFLESIAAELKE